jgi:hypothetical protein
MVLFQGEVQKADTLIKAFYSAKKKGTPEAAAAGKRREKKNHPVNAPGTAEERPRARWLTPLPS